MFQKHDHDMRDIAKKFALLGEELVQNAGTSEEYAYARKIADLGEELLDNVKSEIEDFEI